MSMSGAASWTSPTLTFLLHDRSSGVCAIEATILDVLLPAGALVGGILGWIIIDGFGRRYGNIVGGVLFLISWSILGLFPVLVMMYVARFFAGLAVGIIYLSSGIYLAEVAPSSVRQVLFAVSHLFTNIGFLIQYLVGPYVSYTTLISISIVPTFLYTLGAIFTDESPYYLITKKDHTRAQETLQRLRGFKDVAVEMNAIQETVAQAGEGRLKDLLGDKNRRALWVAAGAMVVKQMTGGWALGSYAGPLLEKADVPPHLGSAILGVTKLLTSAVTIFLTLYFGTKNLVNVSLMGISVSLMTLLVSFVLHQKTNVDTECIVWLPLIALMSFFVFTDFGMGPFPGFIGAELFGQNVKGLGTLLAQSAGNFIALFTMALLTSANIILSLAIFTACSTLSIPILNRFLIDTRGKSLPQLQKSLPEEVHHHM